MSRVYYQVGLPGQPASFSLPDLFAVRWLAETMPPGRYWVDERVGHDRARGAHRGTVW